MRTYSGGWKTLKRWAKRDLTGKRWRNPTVTGYHTQKNYRYGTSYRQTRQIVEKSPAGIRYHRRHYFPASGKKPKKRAWASSKNRTAPQQKTIEKAHKTILIPLHLRETHKKARTPFGLQPLTLFTAAVLLCKIYINIDVQRTIYWRIHKRSRANLYFSTKKRLFFSPLNSMQKSFVCYRFVRIHFPCFLHIGWHWTRSGHSW